MKNFLYLVQTDGPLPDHYKDIPHDNADIVVLNWKDPNSGDIYFPNSTWSQGRTKLCLEAKKKPDKYLYYIFIDDDISFRKGSWRDFENQLLKYQPAIGCASWELRDRFLPRLKHDAQKVFGYDAILNAFHSDVFEDFLVLPYISTFDSVTWWASQFFLCLISSLLYPKHVLQFNNVVIKNNKGRPYPRKITLYQPVKWMLQHVFNFNRDVFKRLNIHHGTALYFITRYPEEKLSSYRIDQKLKKRIFRESYLKPNRNLDNNDVSWGVLNQINFVLRYGIRLRIAELVLEILARVPKFGK